MTFTQEKISLLENLDSSYTYDELLTELACLQEGIFYECGRQLYRDEIVFYFDDEDIEYTCHLDKKIIRENENREYKIIGID